MPTKRIGIHAGAPNAESSLDLMRRAEAAGVQAAWLTTGGTGLDALTLFSAAAVQTENILFGTSIVPTYPRHPIVVAQQAQVIDQLAPGRLRIGGFPGRGAERAQRCRRVKGSRPHFHVIGLKDDAALLGPITLKGENEALERSRTGGSGGRHGAVSSMV